MTTVLVLLAIAGWSAAITLAAIHHRDRAERQAAALVDSARRARLGVPDRRQPR